MNKFMEKIGQYRKPAAVTIALMNFGAGFQLLYTNGDKITAGLFLGVGLFILLDAWIEA
jgi:hypothetical protein